MICIFCGIETETSFHFCSHCGNLLSAHLGGKLNFQNLSSLNAAINSDSDLTVDVCFDLLYCPEVING